VTGAPSPDTLRLTNGVVDVYVATAYGPRVTHYGFAGGVNVFGDGAGAQRETPRGLWRSYGGHRLWIAPEHFPDTYTIDDRPPAIEHDGRRAVLRRARDETTGFVASIELELQPESTDVVVTHVVTNDGDRPQHVAPWGLTVVRPGGVALIPNAVRRAQRDALLPARTMTLWSYTDLSDARFAFGPSFLRLRCDPALTSPNKIGVACERGWFAYVVERTAFVTRTRFDPSAAYPDEGCSVEVYTEGPFCEVETLGPLAMLVPGGSTHHVARWSLVADVDADDDASLAHALAEHAES
jgi:hypothetical protein